MIPPTGIRPSCMPSGSVPEQPGKPHPVLFPGCAGNAGLCHACGSCLSIPLKPPPSNKKAMGLSCSMALIGLGIYSMAMRVDAGSSCWTLLDWEEPPLLPFPGCAGNAGLCPACKSCPGRSGETSPSKKAMGAFTLHGFDWFGDLLGGDTGGCGQLLLSLLGWKESLPRPLSGLCGECQPVPRLRVMPGVFRRNLPRPTKKPWGFHAPWL